MAAPTDSLLKARLGIDTALRAGDRKAALALAEGLTAARPQDPEAHALHSEVALSVGDAARSLVHADAALRLGGPSTLNHVRRGRALRALGRMQDVSIAVAAATTAAATGAAHAQVGDFCVVLADYVAALKAYDRALLAESSNAGYLFNRAAVRRFLGDPEGAERDYDAVLALTPGDAEAQFNRSELRTQTVDRNHLTELAALLGRPGQPWVAEVRLRYALAKEYEDLGRYAESWEALEQGARVRRRHLQYDVRTDLSTVDWLSDAFAQVVPESSLAEPTGPIFIVGMPRTCRTLLDRKLSGHPLVGAAGELPDFAELVVRRASAGSVPGGLTRERLIEASARIDFAGLGMDYLARIEPHRTRRPRITDKMPLNYLYCGLIRRALPTARILHVTRHPLATCHAIYKVLFHQGYPFSYDLDELADYYAGYQRLMDHWKATLPGQILEVSYEDLVREPETQMRRVLKFCGLAWAPECLEPQNRREPSTTASAVQVRRPIYRSSLELWRRYAEPLAPLKARLAAAGVPGLEDDTG